MSKPRHNLTQFHRPMKLKLERWYKLHFYNAIIHLRTKSMPLFMLWYGLFCHFIGGLNNEQKFI